MLSAAATFSTGAASSDGAVSRGGDSGGGSIDGDDATTQLWLSALAAAVFAGTVAVIVTRAIERLGGVLGGILATVPTTIVPASVGIYYSAYAGAAVGDVHAIEASAAEMRDALWVVPLGMLVDGLFLLQWRLLPPKLPASLSLKRRLFMMSCAALGGWAVLAALAWAVTAGVRDALGDKGVLAIGIFALSVSVGIGMVACMTPPDAPPGTNRVACNVLLLRGVTAGSAIAVATLLEPLSEVLAGIFAVFPAIFITSMVAVWLAQGEAVTTGAVGPMMLGSTAVSLYALLYGAVAPSVGAWLGAVVSWPISVLFTSVPFYRFIEWRKRIRYSALTVEAIEDDFDADLDVRVERDGTLTLHDGGNLATVQVRRASSSSSLEVPSAVLHDTPEKQR